MAGPSWKDRYRAWSEEYRLLNRLLPLAFLGGVFVFLLYFITLAPPLTAPSGAYLRVKPGESMSDIATALAQKNLIRSPQLFEFFAHVYGAGTTTISGEYFFATPEPVMSIARRLARGDFELIPIRLTIPEGDNSHQIGDLLNQKLADFDEATFLANAQPQEGYLFPDTYFFLPGEDPNEVIAALESNFQEHVQASTTQAALFSFGKPLSQIVIMASLVEKEASDTRDRRIIAGILWHRIAVGMPLQVDAVFPYIIGVSSLNLTRADLETNSPYNTYLHLGLPPGPISNPGEDSLVAAATPIKTNYLYYLSDSAGTFHYCATYTCQLANERRYLRN